MTKEQMVLLQDRLVRRRQEILNQIDERQDKKMAVPELEADLPELPLDAPPLDKTDHREINEIDHALAKIKKGDFGICEWPGCQRDIGRVRLEIIPTARLCVFHQKNFEDRLQCGEALPPLPNYLPEGSTPLNGQATSGHLADDSIRSQPEEEGVNPPAVIQGAKVVVGSWSKDLRVVHQEAKGIRDLLSTGRASEAHKEMQLRSTEEQTALVLVGGEAREELLSITGQEGGSYSPGVVNALSTEIVIDLLVVESEYMKYNAELLRAMSPGRFSEIVADTLEPIDNPETRQNVAWEWLEATAEVEDVPHRVRLLEAVEVDLLRDALIGIVGQLDLEGEVSPFPGAPKVTRFKLFSESALGGPPPGLYIEDPNIGSVLNYLFEASPELFKRAIRFAWESTRGADGRGADGMEETDSDLEEAGQ